MPVNAKTMLNLYNKSHQVLYTKINLFDEQESDMQKEIKGTSGISKLQYTSKSINLKRMISPSKIDSCIHNNSNSLKISLYTNAKFY